MLYIQKYKINLTNQKNIWEFKFCMTKPFNLRMCNTIVGIITITLNDIKSANHIKNIDGPVNA